MLFFWFLLGKNVKVESSYRGRAWVGLFQRVEKVLWRQPLHVRRPVRSNRLWRRHVTLATALDLIEDDTGNDNEEYAAERTAERDQHDNSVRMMFSYVRQYNSKTLVENKSKRMDSPSLV